MAAAMLALLLAACGPGVGGTGGGDDPSGGGATVSPLCRTPFAGVLDCRADGTTGRVLFADAAVPATAQLAIEGARAQLTARCAGLAFEGDWDGRRFSGTLTTAAGSSAASLDVAAADAGLVLQLFEGAVTVPRFGPVRVDRVSAFPPGC
jgi:hypothetical protein